MDGKITTIKMPIDMYNKVKDKADSNGIPMASVIKIALTEYFKNHDEETTKKGE